MVLRAERLLGSKCREGSVDVTSFRVGVGGLLFESGLLRVVLRALGGASIDFTGETLGLTDRSAETSAMSMLSELKSPSPDVDVARSDLFPGVRLSDDRRGRLSVRLTGESTLPVERRLLAVAVETVRARMDEGELILPTRDRMGVLKRSLPVVRRGDSLGSVLGSNILDDAVDTVEVTRERRGRGLMGRSAILASLSRLSSSSDASTSEFLRLRESVTCFGGSRDALGLYFGSEDPMLSRGLSTCC